MSRRPSAERPTSLADARREREGALRGATLDPVGCHAETGQPYVAAADVVALLNRIGECVRALPSFGRSRTQTPAVVAKRTLSAISTCSPSRLADGDELRPVLARLDTTREALRHSMASGAQRIAIARWLGPLDPPGDDAADDDRQHDGLPRHSYVLCGGQVIRQPDGVGEHGDDVHESPEERIDDLARAGALIAAEIDRLQQLGERRYA